ncbi:hypothetical protein GsuE55_36590 [Geobacillus subterraneus]|uniref:Uncharacterized protein n=1 Tax=Geobacillus subterraneus TaxID=129338 RepID=A0A679FYL5_9BACL|nr:hypothetical protein GsuE55_36590 [Geobacillus subterraneus]
MWNFLTIVDSLDTFNYTGNSAFFGHLIKKRIVCQVYFMDNTPHFGNNPFKANETASSV